MRYELSNVTTTLHFVTLAYFPVKIGLFSIKSGRSFDCQHGKVVTLLSERPHGYVIHQTACFMTSSSIRTCEVLQSLRL